MADSGLLVTISGAALSLLFYENARSVGDQMGFLLGDVVMYVTKNVTDSERHVESERRHIEITGVLTCSAAAQFFDSTGKLYKDSLRTFLRERSKEIVGWFKFRHNSRLVPTFRDKILHKELAAYFNECNVDSPKQYFLACILNASTTERMGTHKFRHILLRYEEGVYRPVALRINNLGNDAARHDGSDYMPAPVTRISHEPDVFTKFVKSLNLDLNHKSRSELVMTIEKAAEAHLKSLIPKVCDSDRKIYEMEKRVEELRLKIVSGTIIPKRFTIDNQRSLEFDQRSPLMIGMDGDHPVQMEIREQTPSKTSNAYEEFRSVKDSPIPKTKGKPMNVLNTLRSPHDSSQKSPSSLYNTYSQGSRKSTDSEDPFEKC